ncbi:MULTISPECIES: response regulator transcription factor [unclassified Paraburkholderia]|uniref:response regulator transcription factor n=1 Tax=unclassified Paraburkholderia TaxID=2615204 RepID=UPI0016081489|nr:MULTISPECIES: response regulator transcription factor [unclassified Paraburkholderia]MBB5447753.1 DNA-binding response OmpR family regulator [Paraburkholderia sp. WSM4177]MBB5488195.1 DNA-binding response OmpR family regulator [Paraburkholderia sp. WSM4180]MBB5497732.1 DNA-binding response OmpR family regulator [Paraburkholderia sp. MM5384-R2]
MKLLLVEDDADLARWVMNLMQVEQFAIDWAQNGECAETLLGLQCYDAVLLDLRLPGMGGKEVLARLRRKRDNVPVLMLTANGSTDDKVACFSAGADDYVVKPFDARELVARIKALIRRQAAGDRGQSTECGDLRYLFDSREFVLRDERLPLRRREHAILEALILKQGKTVSKATLMDKIFTLDEEPSADAIDIYIHRLRKHLSASTAKIMTLRGLGYILREEEPREAFAST